MPVMEKSVSHHEIDADLEDGMVMALDKIRKEGRSLREAARACMGVAKAEIDRLREMNRRLGTELKAEKAKNAQGRL